MAKNPTWKNMSIPSFNSGAIAAAIGSFGNASSGLYEYGNQMRRTQEAENEYLTNLDIAAARRGEATSGSGRVNQALLQESMQSQETHDAAMATNVLEREGLTLDNANQRVTNQYQPQVIQAGLDKEAAHIRKLNADGKLSNAKFNVAMKALQKEERINAGVSSVDNILNDVYDKNLAANWTPEIKEQRRASLTKSMEEEDSKKVLSGQMSPEEFEIKKVRNAEEVNKLLDADELMYRGLAKEHTIGFAAVNKDRLLSEHGISGNDFATRSSRGTTLFNYETAAANKEQQLSDTTKETQENALNMLNDSSDGVITGWKVDPVTKQPELVRNKRAQRNNTLTLPKIKSILKAEPGIDEDSVKEHASDLLYAVGYNKDLLKQVLALDSVQDKSYWGNTGIDFKEAIREGTLLKNSLIDKSNNQLNPEVEDDSAPTSLDAELKFARDKANKDFTEDWIQEALGKANVPTATRTPTSYNPLNSIKDPRTGL